MSLVLFAYVACLENAKRPGSLNGGIGDLLTAPYSTRLFVVL